MARIGIISDVHANVQALDAVLADARRQRLDRIVSLGDLVGYCANPRETIAAIRRDNIEGVHGNHDLMAIERLPINCGPNGTRALEWTRGVLNDGERAYLAALPATLHLGPDVLCMHAAFGDSETRLRTVEDFRRQREIIREAEPKVRLCFTGHTHVYSVVGVASSGLVRVRHEDVVDLSVDAFHFVNPGSVGHPRHSDYRSSYVVYDTARQRVERRRVRYAKRAARAENERHGIHTDLGPSTVTYLGRRLWTAFRAAVRPEPALS